MKPNNQNIRIAGSGSVSSGEYDNIHVSGSAKLHGPVRCLELHSAGSVSCDGDLAAQSLHISGSAHISGDCRVEDKARIAGSLRCDKSLRGNAISIAGSATVTSIEGETVDIQGKIECKELLNAEKVTIKFENTTSSVGSIGGSIIHVFRKDRNGGSPRRRPLLSKLLGRDGSLTVLESIEGDEIALEQVTAPKVTGRVVAIGDGCVIDLVQYSEELEISPHAIVTRSEKI